VTFVFGLKFSLVLMVFLVFASQVFVLVAFAEVSEGEVASALADADEAVVFAYKAVLRAEEAGANVSSLLVRLNEGGGFLARAHMAYKFGDFEEAASFANSSRNIGVEVQNTAVELKGSALIERMQRIWFSVTTSVVSIALIVLGSLSVWLFSKERYGSEGFPAHGLCRTKSLRFRMNVEDYRNWFIVGSLILILLAAAPTFALFVSLPDSSEKFSELWLLGSEHKAKGYPFNVGINETYTVYLGAGNQLGYSAYYRIYVKLRNETQSLPISPNATSSTLPTLYQFDFCVKDGSIWETLLNFKISQVERSTGLIILRSLSINEVTFLINSYSRWNNLRNGFYYQLFFELWLYNLEAQRFLFHNRFVGIWLNLTI
jgi:hypothetical protein